MRQRYSLFAVVMKPPKLGIPYEYAEEEAMAR
jgi:hypothetical protein